MFILEDKQLLQSMQPNFGYGGFGELVYYKSYSRATPNGQEHWADTVTRVIEGTFSIRKQHAKANNLPWVDSTHQQFAMDMAKSLFRLEWSPPGRGLWCMGTELIRQRGAMPLYNCAYTDIGTHWINDLCWLKDLLMCGVGVGFGALNRRCDVYRISQGSDTYAVDDSREGWIDSVRHLLECYRDETAYPKFDYSYVRPKGTPLKLFGGTASGPEPLIQLHDDIHRTCRSYIEHRIGNVQFKTDLANLIGCCVVAGNIRRSAEIALGRPDDTTFMDLKDYTIHPERAMFGWMSNNSAIFDETDDYDYLPGVAYRVSKNGEPGVYNRKNVKYARMGDLSYGFDAAIGLNPCAEIPLENKEVCNLAITCPTRCRDSEQWLHACDYATFYTSTVALLPTHQAETNRVIARNRRIGVDVLDYVGWRDQIGTQNVIKYLRAGYNRIRETNRELAREAGVCESIRVTAIKPNGTVSKLMGRPPGHPNARYMLRRIRIQRDTPLDRLMQEANIPFEPCINQPDTTHVFEYPIYNGDVREVHEVSLWEQAMNLVLLQREWADNAVSNTLYFGADEVDEVENVLSAIVPVTKSISMAPKDCSAAYAQMPEERITQLEYNTRKAAIKNIDWSTFRGDGEDERYCTGEGCSI